MQKLIFINKNETEIDLTSGAFGITYWEGLSNTELNIQTQQVPFNDGGVFLDALMEQREITVTVAVADDGDLEKRYELKRQLISVLNPKLGEGILIYRNNFLSKRIKAVPQLPIFENKNSNDIGTLKASITFSCPSPYWEDLEETEVELTGMNVIENNGDVTIQVKITIPSNSNEFAIINQKNKKQISLQENSKNPIIIDTNFGEKSVKTYENNFVWNSGGLLNRVISVNGRLIIVGSLILTRDNFGDFNRIDFDLASSLLCVTYGNGLYVAGGVNILITSPDGINWTSQSLNIGAYSFQDITYGNGLFVAVGPSSIYTSPDGINWTLKSSFYGGISVIYKKRLFIVVSSMGVIVTSTDGETWNQRADIEGTVRCITYGNGLFVAVGQNTYQSVRISNDLENWTEILLENVELLRSVAYSEKLGLFIAVGGDQSLVSGDYSSTIYTSPDGANWTKLNSDNIKSILNSVIYANGSFIAVGYGGIMITSIDGTNWEIANGIDFSTSFRCITYGNNLFVAGGKNVYTSPDGINWTLRISTSYDFNDVIYANGLFVAIGNNNIFRTSPDGINWSSPYTPHGGDWTSITYGNGLFVVINNSDVIMTSSNGVNWTSHRIGFYGLYGVTYGNGLFVAVGTNRGVTATSPDGANWTQHLIDENISLFSVAYADNLFVAVGTNFSNNSGVIYTSLDGANWTKLNYEAPLTLRKVIYANGSFVAVGNRGTIITSSDGLNWKEDAFTTIDGLYGVCYGNNLIYAVGQNGILLSNSKLTEKNLISKLLPDSDMSFNLEIGENNIMYVNESNKNAILTYRKKYIGV